MMNWEFHVLVSVVGPISMYLSLAYTRHNARFPIVADHITASTITSTSTYKH
jgi:hypothetical protein